MDGDAILPDVLLLDGGRHPNHVETEADAGGTHKSSNLSVDNHQGCPTTQQYLQVGYYREFPKASNGECLNLGNSVDLGEFALSPTPVTSSQVFIGRNRLVNIYIISFIIQIISCNRNLYISMASSNILIYMYRAHQKMYNI